VTSPVGPASAQNRSRQTIVSPVTTDAGVVGWGETSALAGVRAAIDQVLTPLVVGQDPLDAGALWQRLWAASFGNGFAVGGV
jgi:L-alanine-DL-glutamate epimerase-like enolase superfamily enzyme